MDSSNAEATARYHRGLLDLREYLWRFDESVLARSVDSFRVASRLAPETCDHWVALGFALDMSDDPGGALAAMRRAVELDPSDQEAEVFVLTLLAEAGRETEALTAINAMAKRSGVDLESLRRELAAGDMPVDARTLLMNGFLHARNFVRSRLDDAMDSAGRVARPQSVPDADLEECRDRLSRLEQEVDPVKVPPELRHLVTWMLRLGVGDDPCRALLVDALTRAEQGEALQAFQGHAAAAHAWLDSFGDSPLPPEAATLMYSMLALESMEVQWGG